MISQLFIRLTESPAHTYQWGVAKHGIFTLMSAAAFTEIAKYIYAEEGELFEVIVLLPGEAVFSSVITVPEQQAKYLQQSLPFLVEESLTHDIADMYLVQGPKVERNQYVVMGIERTKLEQWLTDLKAARIDPRVMISDHACCPANSAIITSEITLLRLSEHQSQSIDTENLDNFLAHYVSQNRIPTLEWIMDAQTNPQQDSWIKPIEESLTSQKIVFSKKKVDSVLQVLAQQYLQAPVYYHAINFLQGKYAQKTMRKMPHRGWRQTGLLVCALLMLYLMLNIAQGVYLNVKTAQLEKQSKQYYKELFPADTVTDNVRAQMTGKLKSVDSSSAKGAFLDTYSLVVTLIQQNQLQAALDVTQVSFNAENGEVHLELLARSIEQITQLKELLVKESLNAEIGSTSNEAGKTKANLKIWQ